MNWSKDDIARIIIRVGTDLGITRRGIIIGIATGLVESNLTVYANAKVPGSLDIPHDAVGSDGYSVGVQQQQVVKTANGWWWGDVNMCQLPETSTRLFFKRLETIDYNGPNSPGSYAQKIQGSAYPDRYDQRFAEATAIYNRLAGGTTPAPTGGAPMGDPIWLTQVLRSAGLTVKEIPGAYQRGHGDFGNIWGVICHHTGSNGASAESIAYHPTLGLASQLHLDQRGVFTLCGVGVAWHAGQGSWSGIEANNANQVTIGIEAANDGTSGWPAAQYNAYVKAVAAILKKLGHNESHVIGHKEWGAIQGKWDPGGIDMNKFRRDVAAALKGVAAPAIVNEINECAKRTPWVGERKQVQETPVGKDGKGRMVPFENAHIYFYPQVGAFAIPHGGLFEAYGEYNYERGVLGYPVRDYTRLDNVAGKGAVQAYQGGVLYLKDGGKPFYVVGEIGKRFANEGYEKGWGYPTSNEIVDENGNRVQHFEHFDAYWHSTGVVTVKK